MTTLLPEREVGQAGLLGLGGGHPNSHSLHPSLLPHPLSRDAQQEAHLGDHLPPPPRPRITAHPNRTPWSFASLWKLARRGRKFTPPPPK